jgi:hypothetical protein
MPSQIHKRRTTRKLGTGFLPLFQLHEPLSVSGAALGQDTESVWV